MTGELIDDRYRLLSQIGAGGEACVFRARDERNGEEVALRVARQRDVDTPPMPSASFTHERWVRLLASGWDDGFGAYQVFELLDGRTLAEIVHHAPLSPGEWRTLVDHSLAAVMALHALGLIHADLNADNFIRTRAGWKLLELPFQRFTATAPRSAAFGSIYTLAPEQVNGSPATERSDLYSLGCLYYYAAAGRWPHEGRNAQEVAISCLLHAPVHLHEAAPALGLVPARAVMSLLSVRPAERPASVVEAERALADEIA